MKNILIILLSLLISIPVILPFFHTGYFPTHDGEWAVVRLGDMFRTLRDLQIPARYSGELNFGYGYPLFNFVYPFPYYLGIFIHLLRVGFVDTVKIIFAGSVFLSAFFMFFASRALWRNTWAGIISAVLYVYFPYRMIDLYVRGSIGESLSFVLFPLLFYLSIKLINKVSFLPVFGIAIFIGVLVITHNIMTVLFMPLFVVFFLGQAIFKNKKAIKPFIASIISGFGLSAFFWIPALYEKSNILLSKIPIADRDLYFVSLQQFLYPRWGYGSPVGPNGFSYQLGIAHLAIFIVVVLFLIFILVKNKYAIKEYSSKNAISLILLIVLFTFLLFKPSNFLWANLPLLSEINYPWISLGILGFSISLLAGFLCKQTIGKYVAIFFGVFAILLVLPYAKPESYFDKGDDYYLTNDATTTSSNELMPLWVKKNPQQRPIEKVEILQGTIYNLVVRPSSIVFDATSSEATKVTINTIYFPGWKLFIDSNNSAIDYENDKGVIQFNKPAGIRRISLHFFETPMRFASDIVSAVCLLVLLLIILNIERKKTV